MIELCEISQNQKHKFEDGVVFDLTSKENVHKQNLVIKEEIYYYFNAKYFYKINKKKIFKIFKFFKRVSTKSWQQNKKK